jgi:hypothetical protein
MENSEKKESFLPIFIFKKSFWTCPFSFFDEKKSQKTFQRFHKPYSITFFYFIMKKYKNFFL